jgi:hypothetical protein
MAPELKAEIELAAAAERRSLAGLIRVLLGRARGHPLSQRRAIRVLQTDGDGG